MISYSSALFKFLKFVVEEVGGTETKNVCKEANSDITKMFSKFRSNQQGLNKVDAQSILTIFDLSKFYIDR